MTAFDGKISITGRTLSSVYYLLVMQQTKLSLIAQDKSCHEGYNKLHKPLKPNVRSFLDNDKRNN